MPKFLVIVIDRNTRETLAEYPEVEADDWYYARQQIVTRFPVDHPELAKEHKGKWCTDSLDLNESTIER